MEAVWAELLLVSDLEVAEGAFPADGGRLYLQMWVDAAHTWGQRRLVTSEVSVLLGSWLSSLEALPYSHLVLLLVVLSHFLP